MKNKINLVSYWKYGLLICIMLTWIIAKFILRKSELYIIPAVLIYLILSALLFRGYFYGLVGNYCYIRMKPDKAMKYYEKAVKLNTMNIKALYNYGLENLHKNKPDEALAALDRANKLNTKPLFDKLIPLAQSSCYWLLNDIDKAIEILEELRYNYKYLNPSTYVTLGYFYMLKKDYAKAEEITNLALKDNPQFASAYDNLGQIYYNINDFETAEKYFKQALEIKENTVESLYYLALIEKNKGNNDKALSLLKKADKCYISALNTITKEDVEKAIKNIKK